MGKVIHFGWDDCYRVQVLRFAGYEVRESQTLDKLAIDLQRDDQIDAVVLSEDDWHNLPETVAVIQRFSAAPLILFRRTRHRIDESKFDRVFYCLVPPEIWLSETAELIAMSRALPIETRQTGLKAEAAGKQKDRVFIPDVFDRVRVRGREGVYLAFRINLDHKNADLVRMIGKHRVEHGVSFAMLERVADVRRYAY